MATTAFRHSRFRAVRMVRARPRLFTATVLAVLIIALAPKDWRPVTSLLIAWNAAIWLYLATSAVVAVKATQETIRRRASFQDEGRFFILIFSSLAAVASIGAIIAELAIVKELHGMDKALHIGLAAATIISAWLFIHLMFAMHYAHEYFIEHKAEQNRPEEFRGGLTFPGNQPPDYLDFLYFSYVIGVASQTADIAICSKEMRRIALVQCVLAFFFNSAVLALTINIAAGLI
jgi:uncharacterized membrane protein